MEDDRANNREQKKIFRAKKNETREKKMLFKDSSSILYCRKFCLNAFLCSRSPVLVCVCVCFSASSSHTHRARVCVYVLLMAIVRPFQSKRIIHRTIREKSLPISFATRSHSAHVYRYGLYMDGCVCVWQCVLQKCTVLGDARVVQLASLSLAFRPLLLRRPFRMLHNIFFFATTFDTDMSKLLFLAMWSHK